MCLFKVFARLSSTAERSCWHPTFPRLFAFFTALIIASSFTMIIKSTYYQDLAPAQLICKTERVVSAPAPVEMDAEIVTVNDNLQYIDIIEGTGVLPQTGDTIVTRIPIGPDEPLFQSDQEPEERRYIFGSSELSFLQDGLATMRVGGRRKFICKFADRDMTFEFEVDLLNVEKTTRANLGK